MHSDSVGHVRWAVVLAGEGPEMERSETAYNLFRDGRFDSLMLSGPRIFKSHHESEFSREYLISRGFPKDRIFQLPNESSSTLEEALAIIHQARLLGIDTLLVITSNYHSARARRIFQKLADGNPGVLFQVAALDFDPKSWWTARTSQVIWILEWMKTLHSMWEMRGEKPLPLNASNGVLLLEPNPRMSKHETLSPLSQSSLSISIPDTGTDSTGHDSKR